MTQGALTRASRLGAATLAVLVATAASAWAVAQNDAGSGGDAGDTPEGALRVFVPTAFSGDASDAARVDWYKWKSKFAAPTCTQADVTAQTLLGARLVGVDGSAVSEIDASVLTTRPVRMGLAVPTVKAGLLEVKADAVQPESLLGYSTQLAVVSTLAPPPGDAGSGDDAPATRAGALPLPSACAVGAIAPGDAADVYSWSAQAGDRVTVSVGGAGSGVQAQILSASGVLSSLLSGQLSTVTLPSTGTYYISVTSASPGAYALGLCEPNCGPPESPCNPMCAMAVAD